MSGISEKTTQRLMVENVNSYLNELLRPENSKIIKQKEISEPQGDDNSIVGLK